MLFDALVDAYSETEYNDMVKDKTGGLFRMCFKLMQAFSTSVRDFSLMIELLSLYFQIRDDYVNLTRYCAILESAVGCTDDVFLYIAQLLVHGREVVLRRPDRGEVFISYNPRGARPA